MQGTRGRQESQCGRQGQVGIDPERLAYMNPVTFRLLEFPKVLGLLSGLASSEAGAAACLDIRPLPEHELAEARELLREWIAWTGESGFTVPAFPDISGLLAAVARPGEVLEMDGLVTLAEVLDGAKQARDLVLKAEAERWPGLAAWMGRIGWPDKTASAIRRCVSPDGVLKDQSSPELFAVREEIRGIHRRCTKKVKEYLSNEIIQQYLQEEWMTVSSDRYVLPLKTNFKGRIKGIIHDYSQTGETCYFEPLFLVDLNNKLQELKREEREAERKVYLYLTGIVRSERESVEQVYDFMVQADVCMAKARFAGRTGAAPLDIAQGLPLRLTKVHHPLLLLKPKDARDVPLGKAVPVDIELAEDQRILVISGGNAGGKTVALKTLGISALMAASNIPVPAREGSSLPRWRDIRVLLGDQQSIEDSLSTFTAQIDGLSKAWESIDDEVLVIMDEFGAGTDPTQGAALAQAVLDGLLEKGAWAAVATHFPALKAYALAGEGVRSASVLFDPDSRKPLFELAYDLAGESQALAVAKERGLPVEILERAEKYLLMEGPETDGVMERLNELATKRSRELERLQSERAKLEEKRRKLEKKFTAEKDALLSEIKGKAQGIVREWQKDKISRKRALKELADVRETLSSFGREDKPEQKQEAPTALDMDSATPGTMARYPAFGKTGVIREADAKRGLVKLDMDGVAMWLKPEDLERQDAPRETSQAQPGARASAPAGLSLDLRGFRADEARAELQRFLDRAILSGHQHLEVVHGKGTGALRREVQDVLKRSPAVSNYELAPEEMGGDGMTKVELK